MAPSASWHHRTYEFNEHLHFTNWFFLQLPLMHNSTKFQTDTWNLYRIKSRTVFWDEQTIRRMYWVKTLPVSAKGNDYKNVLFRLILLPAKVCLILELWQHTMFTACSLIALKIDYRSLFWLLINTQHVTPGLPMGASFVSVWGPNINSSLHLFWQNASYEAPSSA